MVELGVLDSVTLAVADLLGVGVRLGVRVSVIVAVALLEVEDVSL